MGADLTVENRGGAHNHARITMINLRSYVWHAVRIATLFRTVWAIHTNL